jgi:hypothetical protein
VTSAAVEHRLGDSTGKSKADDSHDQLVLKIVQRYKNYCTVYVAKTNGEDGKTSDLIIKCKPTEKCKRGLLLIIEVKGKAGLDHGVTQLDAAAKAGLDAGQIEAKPDKKSLNDCYKSFIVTRKGETLDKKGDLGLEHNQTPIGDQKITPVTTDKVDDLPFS